ncbi:MAG TPA: hypothetical protein PLA13_06270, partial [Microbacteriaceae bacterium]|nr:hypothetical protein [Microbacteriaceae bacterium]
SIAGLGGSTELQFIAYGTLRPGHGNSALWTGYEGASSQPVTIPNVKLLGQGEEIGDLTGFTPHVFAESLVS